MAELAERAINLLKSVEEAKANELKDVDELPIGFCALHKESYVGYCETCKIPICSKCLSVCNGHVYKDLCMFIGNLENGIPKRVDNDFIKKAELLYDDIRKNSHVINDDRGMLLEPMRKDALSLNDVILKLPNDVEILEDIITHIRETSIGLNSDIFKKAVNVALDSLRIEEKVHNDIKSHCSDVEFTIEQSNKKMKEAQNMLVRSRCVYDAIQFYKSPNPSIGSLERYEQISVIAGIREIEKYIKETGEIERLTPVNSQKMDTRDLFEMLDDRKTQIVNEYEAYKKDILNFISMLAKAEGTRRQMIERRISCLKETNKRLLEEIHLFPGMRDYE